MKVSELRAAIAEWPDEMDVVFAQATTLCLAEQPKVTIPGRQAELKLQALGVAQVVTTIQAAPAGGKNVNVPVNGRRPG